MTKSKKLVSKEKHLSTLRKAMDAVESKVEQSHQAAREAALATLDPITAINRSFIPGRCDGEVNSTVKFFTTFKNEFVSVAGGTGPGAAPYATQLRIAPFPFSEITFASAFDTNPAPSASIGINDDLYAEMLAEFEGVRCTGQMLEVRCLDNPLDLSGDRTLALGGNDLYTAGYPDIVNRKDVYTTGNNRPGEVSRYINPDPGDGEFHPADYDWMVGTSFEGNLMHVSLETENQATWLVTVVTLWEGIPIENSLLTPTQFVGDPGVFAAALSAALEQCPLNSHERISYIDDGPIKSVASDVKTVIGIGKEVVSAAKQYKKYAKDAVNFFDSFGAGIGSVVSAGMGSIGNLFGRRRHGSTLPESKGDPLRPQMAAALLYMAVSKARHPLDGISAIREVLNGRSDQAVWDYLLDELNLRRELPPARTRIKPARTCREEWADVPRVPRRR